MKAKSIFLIILFLFIIKVSNAQNDSLNLNFNAVNANIYYNHSPKKATLLSTFIPGAGQIYNKQVWKVPIIYMAAAGITYFAITNGQNKEKFKKEYYNRIDGKTELLLTDYTNYTNDGIYNLYNSYKSNFQLSIIVGVLFYAVQILDAYVYGHLFNFDISNDISFNIMPYYTPKLNNLSLNQSIGLSLNLNF